MSTTTLGPAATRAHLKIFCLSIAGLLVCVVLLGTLFAAGAQAATTYNAQEIAFINSLNQYRAANSLQPLLLSDELSESSYRHNHDMAKYKFFSHYSEHSDWFAVNATPWTRMAASGYTYSTSMAENIAAGYGTAAQVLAAWKGSPGHNTNMLGSAYKVIGVSFYQLAGSPYTYYWTTDFGGYVDPTAHAPGVSPPALTAKRYEQAYPRLRYTGTWSSYPTTRASGGSYRRSKSGDASVTVTFTGTYLAWIATKGTTLSKAYVSLDGGAAKSVDLARSTGAFRQAVWKTGTLPSGKHTVKIWRDPKDAADKYISVDAFDVIGALNY